MKVFSERKFTMRKMKKMMVAVAAVMALAAGSLTAFATEGGEGTTSTPSITIVPNNTAAGTQSLAIQYTYYQILEASIDMDSVVDPDSGATTTAGTAAYFVTTQERADQLDGTGLFNITKVDGQNKWYVELKDRSETGAHELIDAFEAGTFDLTVFPTGTFDKTAGEAQAESGELAPGYYYIQSSLGTKAAVQTLSAVTINEKNTYPSNTKTDDKEYAAIDDTVTYTVTVIIPESVASKPITIVDTITDGLTLDTAVTVAGAADEPAYTTAAFTAGAHTAGTDGAQGTTMYTLEIPAATVFANKGKTLTFTYTAKVNENAVVLQQEHNKAHITYDGFETVDADTDVTTLAFDFQKVDGSDKTTVLAGAEFRLYDADVEGNEIEVVLKEAASEQNGQVNTYRVAKAGEEVVVITAGTVRIEGLDNKVYYLEETKAPTGYNKLDGRSALHATAGTAPADNIDAKIENNKGGVLPSTGGIGTTIFYVIGAILVIAAGVLLVARRRTRDE